MATSFFLLGTGMLTGGLLFWWFQSKREHRDEPEAVTDLLNYSHFEDPDGVLRLKDGGLLAMYHYRGPSLSHQTTRLQDHASRVISRFLSQFGNGWAFYFTTQRTELKDYPTRGKFPDPVNESIDQIRSRRFSSGQSYYTNRYVLSIVWMPGYRGAVEDFNSRLQEIEEELRSIDDFYIDRMDANEMLSDLSYTLNGVRQSISNPSHPDFVDGLIGHNEIFQIPCSDHHSGSISRALQLPNYYRLKIGEKYIGAITISGVPFETWAGIFEELNELNVEFRFSNRVITMDRSDQEKKIDRIRELYRFGRKSPTELLSAGQAPENERMQEAYENKHVLNMMSQAGEAISQVRSNKDSFAHLTSTFVIYSDDASVLEKQEMKIISKIRKLGCVATKEKLQPLRALLGTMPGHAENIRRYFMSCDNIADMVPLWGVWTGPEENTSDYMAGAPAHWVGVNVPTTNNAGDKKGQPFIKHQPISGDVGHKLILGPTGSGKSTYINFEISQWRRLENAQVFLFDKGNSGETLCRASGGAHYDIEGENGITFQPFKYIENNPVWFNDWVEMMCALQGVDLRTNQKREIQRGIEAMSMLPEERRTMSEFVFQIQDKPVRDALRVYTSSGKYDIFDGTEDSISTNPYQVYEQERLLEMSDQILLPVLDYLFFRVEQRLSKDRPTLIFIEEAWKAFREKKFSDRLEQWLRELRKRNAHVGLITQSPVDILNFENATLFQDSCPEKVFLANPNATASHYQKIYDLFGLNKTQIEIIQNARPKREYYLHTPIGSALVDLRLDDFSLAFLGEKSGLSISERKKTISRLEEMYGEQWPVRWLDMLELSEEERFLKKKYRQTLEV